MAVAVAVAASVAVAVFVATEVGCGEGVISPSVPPNPIKSAAIRAIIPTPAKTRLINKEFSRMNPANPLDDLSSWGEFPFCFLLFFSKRKVVYSCVTTVDLNEPFLFFPVLLPGLV